MSVALIAKNKMMFVDDFCKPSAGSTEHKAWTRCKQGLELGLELAHKRSGG